MIVKKNHIYQVTEPIALKGDATLPVGTVCYCIMGGTRVVELAYNVSAEKMPYVRLQAKNRGSLNLDRMLKEVRNGSAIIPDSLAQRFGLENPNFPAPVFRVGDEVASISDLDLRSKRFRIQSITKAPPQQPGNGGMLVLPPPVLRSGVPYRVTRVSRHGVVDLACVAPDPSPGGDRNCTVPELSTNDLCLLRQLKVLRSSNRYGDGPLRQFMDATDFSLRTRDSGDGTWCVGGVLRCPGNHVLRVYFHDATGRSLFLSDGSPDAFLQIARHLRSMVEPSLSNATVRESLERMIRQVVAREVGFRPVPQAAVQDEERVPF